MSIPFIYIFEWVILIGTIIFLPPLLLGVLRKIKASLQNRIGAPIWQPFFDLTKLFGKSERISDSASPVLRGAAIANAATAVVVALSSPWIAGMPVLLDADIFVFIYLFVLLRFITVISALDTGSPFGGFAASREVTIAVLVEPAIMLCLIALAVVAQTTSLSALFSFNEGNMTNYSGLWMLAGCGIYLSSLVELSRMPADDPTTHLELTMVHEAMILENSGANLALTEYAAALKLLVLMGMSGQCFLHALPFVWRQPGEWQAVLGVVALFGTVSMTAFIEATAVKLQWTKLPEFIAYAVTFGLLSAVFALGAMR